MHIGVVRRLPDRLSNRICPVAGGAQGIGWATACAIAARGGQMYICDISREQMQTAQARTASSPWPDRFHFADWDVADWTQVEAWLDSIYQHTERIDVLVNNAAFVRWQDVLEMSVAIQKRRCRWAPWASCTPLRQSGHRAPLHNHRDIL